MNELPADDSLEFEWDTAKNDSNFEKHGIDFDDAIGLFGSYRLEYEDTRRDYKERRVVAIGELHGHVIVVVYTFRNGVRRIISARRASRNEREAYRQALAERPPDRSD